jgi:hypothetical protein
MIMRRNRILTASLLVSAILIAVASAQAQTVWTYQAEIPFDFAIGDKTYGAGQFVIKLERPNYLANILTIRNTDGERTERNALTKTGRRSGNEKTTLVFDRYENGFVLKEIVAPNFGFTAPKPGTAVWVYITRNTHRELETVAIVLEKPVTKTK